MSCHNHPTSGPCVRCGAGYGALCRGRIAYGETDPNGCGDRATHPPHRFPDRPAILSPFVRRALAGTLPAKETVRA